MRHAKIATTIAYIAISLCAFCAYAEEAGKDLAAASIPEVQYSKDTVPVENNYACQIGYEPACELPVLLNKNTNKVEYFWSSTKKEWIAAGDQQATLQVLYDKREKFRSEKQLKEMQGEINGNMQSDFQSQSIH